MLLATISFKPNFKIKNNEGFTPLELAVKTSCIHIAAPLLQAGANPNLRSNSFPLSLAIKQNDEKMVHLLLKFDANPNMDNDNFPFISDAAERGNDKIVKLLIQYNAELNKLKYPPLIALLKSQSVECLKLLLTNGADPTQTFPSENQLITVQDYYMKIKTPLIMKMIDLYPDN